MYVLLHFCLTSLFVLNLKKKSKVLFQQKVAIFDSESLLAFQIDNSPTENASYNEQFAFDNLNNSSLFIRTENLLFCIDMTNMQSSEDQILFIDDDFEEPNATDIHEFNGNQYLTEIRRIIESHDAKWISYQPGKSQNSKPFDTDDHTISSVERI